MTPPCTNPSAVDAHRLPRRQFLLCMMVAPVVPGLANAAAATAAHAFADMGGHIETQVPSVQAVAVLVRGQMVYEYDRDGRPGTPRDVQSVDKSVTSALVGAALADGRLDLRQPIVELMPEWAQLNADPRSRAITLHHLLSMSTGFDVRAPYARSGAAAWARPLVRDPGEAFAYDNALNPIAHAVVAKAVGMPLAEYARRKLIEPLGVEMPDTNASGGRGLQLRVQDMARLGQLFLQRGQWNGVQLVDAGYIDAATTAQNAGGWPGHVPYGHGWGVPPAGAERRTYMAFGLGGQYVWVHPPLDLVIAVQSVVPREQNAYRPALDLIRGPLRDAARRVHAGASPAGAVRPG